MMTVALVAVRVSPVTMHPFCARFWKQQVSMRRLWALHIFFMLSRCGWTTSSNKISYAYHNVVRNCGV